MAIHVVNPNTIGNDVEGLYGITVSQGQNLITDLETTINNLAKHWTGTDATANLEDLKKVYEYVCSYVTGVQRLISEVNELEIIPLLKHIELSGGLRANLASCSEKVKLGSVSIPSATQESWTDAQIITDAVNFDGFPKKMENFVVTLESAKERLMNNWKEGAGRENVLNAFKSYYDSYSTHKNKVEQVRNNLNIVAENKKQFM